MGRVIRYFRMHRWQRRMLTLVLAAIVGVLGAWQVWPRVQMSRALRELDSRDFARREQGIRRVVELGRQYPKLVGQIESGLDSADDERFATLAEVLGWLMRFDQKSRRGDQLDRYWAISLCSTGSRAAALILLQEVTLSGRDDRYVREMIATAAGAKDPDVRSAGALLAAKLGDDEMLRRLLGDADPNVRGVAALDAALADRKALRETVAPMLAEAGSDFQAACAAYALWTWGAAQEVAEAALSADADGQAQRRDLLLCALAAPGGKADARRLAEKTVVELLARAGERKEVPSTMTFIAAGRLGVREAVPFVTETVQTVLSERAEVPIAHVESLAAAMQTARRLRAQTVGPVTRVLAELWHPGTAMIMILGCEALGQTLSQTDLPAGGSRPAAMPAATTRATTPARVPRTAVPTTAATAPLDPVEMLRRGAQYPDTPLASAAAAVALFQIDPDGAEDFLRLVCETDDVLACNYVAWQLQSLARKPSPRQQRYRAAAEAVADSFTTGGSFSVGVPAAGAILWAYLARGTDRAEAAAERIARKLQANAGPNDDLVLSGSYRCALLILGRSEYRRDVVNLLEDEQFPRDRAVTALILSAEPTAGLDHILGKAGFDFAWIDAALAGRLMARVVEQVAPSLPPYDIDAPAAARAFQGRILRDAYLIQRDRITEELKRYGPLDQSQEDLRFQALERPATPEIEPSKLGGRPSEICGNQGSP